MSGDGFGAPPWGPADPVPELEDTQVIPGLGPVSGPGEPSGRSRAGQGSRPSGGFGHAFQAAGGAGDFSANGAGASAPGGGAGAPLDSPPDPEEGKDARGGKSGKRRRSFWRELPVLIIVALVLALLIKSFAVQAFYIPSGSMQNTLEIGDRVLINKVVYRLRPIDRGDIVVFDGSGSWDFNSPRAAPTSSARRSTSLRALSASARTPASTSSA